MPVEVQPSRPPQKASHPAVPELVRGLNLGAAALRARPDADRARTLIEVLANAEYWLSFDLASFEPILALCPSPLRELGVGVALRFGEGVDGTLAAGDLERARAAILAGLPEDLAAGVGDGLDTLGRAIAARDAVPALLADGFEVYAPSAGLSVHALRAMGRAKIEVGGGTEKKALVEAPVGARLTLAGTDERGKPIEAPEVESRLRPPIYTRPTEGNTRSIVLVVPGRYQIRVPGRAEGDRVLIAR